MKNIKEHKKRVIKNWHLIVIAMIAIMIAFTVHDGLSHVTIGAVIGRVFDMLGDVFADRSFGMDS